MSALVIPIILLVVSFMAAGLLCSFEFRDEDKWSISAKFYSNPNQSTNKPKSIAAEAQWIASNLIMESDEIIMQRDWGILSFHELACRFIVWLPKHVIVEQNSLGLNLRMSMYLIKSVFVMCQRHRDIVYTISTIRSLNMFRYHLLLGTLSAIFHSLIAPQLDAWNHRGETWCANVHVHPSYMEDDKCGE